MSSAGIQKLFCGIYSTFKCSFDEFVGEKAFSPSYSSTILAPPPDYILCSQRWRRSIQSAKIRLGADCGSDQELLIAKFRLKLKKVAKTTKLFRYDLNQIPYDYTVEVTNRFKGLDLIHRMPEKLWMEVRDIVQEAVIKTISKKKKCKKAKWFSEEALQLAENRRDVKGKGEKQRYIHWLQSFKEQQGEIRKPSSVITAKK